jgi:hypothetical protein
MRFRIMLPIANVMLGVVLFHVGDLQARRIVAANAGHLEEPLQDGVAKARYIHYALNAPAWALLGDTRDSLWETSTYWTGHDLHYFLAVTIMWFLIGLKLDRTSSGGHRSAGKWGGIFAWSCILLGIFVCYTLISAPPLSIKAYLLLSFRSVIRLENGWWFLPVGLAWGIGLILTGAYGLVLWKGARKGLRFARD